MQSALKEAGYKVGRIDGDHGNKTTKAIKQYQEANDLQGDGKMTQQTLDALGVTVTE